MCRSLDNVNEAVSLSSANICSALEAPNERPPQDVAAEASADPIRSDPLDSARPAAPLCAVRVTARCAIAAANNLKREMFARRDSARRGAEQRSAA